MTSLLLKEVRRSYGVRLNFAASDLANQEPLVALNEFQRMLNGERRTFFRRYNGEHVHTAIIGIGSTRLNTALNYLREIYFCEGHPNTDSNSRVIDELDESAFGVVTSTQVDYVFPRAPSALSRFLEYSIDAEEGITQMHHLQVRTSNHHHRMMQLSINNLERSLGLPVSPIESFLPNE